MEHVFIRGLDYASVWEIEAARWGELPRPEVRDVAGQGILFSLRSTTESLAHLPISCQLALTQSIC